jgi:hypothetical protein
MVNSFNNGQDNHFTSPQYLEKFMAIQVNSYMDGRECAKSGIFTEQLYRTINYEKFYLHNYANPKDAYLGLSLFT